MNFISQNVRGIRDNFKRRYIYRSLHEGKFDLVYLQETHSSKNDEARWRNEWGGRVIFAHGTNRSCGVAILLRRGLNLKITDTILDQHGRYIVLKTEYEGKGYTLANLYGPNEDKPQFFQEVFSKVEQCRNDLRIVAGDFNLILNNELDKKGESVHAHRNASEFLNQYMQNEDLVDIWRNRNPESFKFTWHKRQSQSRLDFFLISGTLVNQVVKLDIKPAYKSDHSRPYLSISPNTVVRGNGYWKLNTLLLEEKEYVDKINEIIKEQLHQDYEDAILTWEMIKLKAREFSLSYAIQRKKQAITKMNMLENKAQKLEEKLASEVNPVQLEQLNQNLIQTKSDIAAINEEKTKGCFIRSKMNWLEGGEKNSSYFFALEQRNYNRKCINKLRLKDGQITTEFKTILQEQKRFYQELYKARQLNEENQKEFELEYLSNIKPQMIKKISNQDRERLDQQITIHEVYDAIMSLSDGKTPGSDGFPIDFYKKFWSQIKHVLFQVYKLVLRQEKLHTTARHVVISLLNKPDSLKIGDQ